MRRRWQENEREMSGRHDWRADERDARHHTPSWGDWGGERYDNDRYAWGRDPYYDTK